MVVPSKKSTSSAIKPASFYGNSLPRPRFFTDAKLNKERVDPPVSVLDPLHSWANDAHWSMGGLNFTRIRLQGRIEGNLSKLRTQRESQIKNATDSLIHKKKKLRSKLKSRSESKLESLSPSPLPPSAPVLIKRKKMLLDSSDQEDEETVKSSDNSKRGMSRKLWVEFEKVPMESDEIALKKTKKNRSEVNGENSNKVSRNRTSPRLAKLRLM